MKILLIGSGGREHAICWKLSQSPKVDAIVTVPGNPGTATVAKNTNRADVAQDPESLAQFAKTEGFDLTVVGPEKPLADGIVDTFEAAGLLIFGPSRAAARLESSKAFAKSVMNATGVPTAKSEIFDDADKLLSYLDRVSYPVVLKADGLAQGKGVAICATLEEARTFAQDCMKARKFSDAGKTVMVEEYLEGTEVSFLVFASGRSFAAMDTAQDHKKLLDGDCGPNTGGMGAVSPVNLLSIEQRATVENRIIRPVLDYMADEGAPFYGILYAGLMMTSSGPKVLEFNVRFGDPEAQVLLPRLQGDLAEIFESIAHKESIGVAPRFDPQYAVGIVLASEGYPENPVKGDAISLPENDRTLVFHAGTAKESNGRIVTNGGRVLCVVALDEHLNRARDRAYHTANAIDYRGKVMRSDIGAKLMEH